MIEKVGSYEQRLEPTGPQVEALEAIEQARAAGVPDGYLDMATGLGKTLVAALDTALTLTKYPNTRVAYVCHNTDILDQARETFGAVLGPHVSLGNIYGNEIDDRAQVTFASFQKLNSNIGSDKLYKLISPTHFGHTVWDEIHHGPAPTYRPIIDYFQPQTSLGLTATPDRRDQQDLTELIGPRLYDHPLERAIAEGHLAQPEYHVLTDNLRDVMTLQDDLSDISLSELNKLIFIPKRDIEIADTINGYLERQRDSRTLVFCNNIAHAEHMAKILPGRLATLHSGLSPRDQQSRLRRFHNGALDTLVTVDKFNEGVDVPDINTVIFLRSTESRTVFLQQLGRGLRKIPGKEKVLVLDFVANWERIKDVKALEQGVRGQKMRKTTTNRGKQADTAFSFSFSQEAYDALEIIEHARDIKNTPRPKPVQLRDKQQAEAAQALGHPLPKRTSYENSLTLMAKAQNADIEARDKLILGYAGQVYSRCLEAADGDTDRAQDYFQTVNTHILERFYEYDESKHKRPHNLFLQITNDVLNRQRSVGDGTPMRYSLGVSTAIEEYLQIAESLEDKTGHTPSIASVAEALGISEKKAWEISQYAASVMQPYYWPKEVEAIVDQAPSLLDDAAKQADKWEIREKLEDLPYRERRIMELYYGLGGEEPRTLDQMGRTFNVTRERIRQIINGASKKLESTFDYERFNNVVGRQAIDDRIKQELGRRSHTGIDYDQERSRPIEAQDIIDDVAGRRRVRGPYTNPEEYTPLLNEQLKDMQALGNISIQEAIDAYGIKATWLAFHIISVMDKSLPDPIFTNDSAHPIIQGRAYIDTEDIRDDISSIINSIPKHILKDGHREKAWQIVKRHTDTKHTIMGGKNIISYFRAYKPIDPIQDQIEQTTDEPAHVIAKRIFPELEPIIEPELPPDEAAVVSIIGWLRSQPEQRFSFDKGAAMLETGAQATGMEIDAYKTGLDKLLYEYGFADLIRTDRGPTLFLNNELLDEYPNIKRLTD